MKRLIFALAIIAWLSIIVGHSVVTAGTRALHKAQERAESVE